MQFIPVDPMVELTLGHWLLYSFIFIVAVAKIKKGIKVLVRIGKKKKDKPIEGTTTGNVNGPLVEIKTQGGAKRWFFKKLIDFLF